jgi:hypothetical protein
VEQVRVAVVPLPVAVSVGVVEAAVEALMTKVLDEGTDETM